MTRRKKIDLTKFSKFQLIEYIIENEPMMRHLPNLERKLQFTESIQHEALFRHAVTLSNAELPQVHPEATPS
jgi:hypothetical protein